MSASRTLLRRNDKQMFARRLRLGKKIKPGTPRRRCRDLSKLFVTPFPHPLCLVTYKMLGLEADYHATKGLLVRLTP